MMSYKLAKVISFVLGPYGWFPVLITVFLLNTGLTREQQSILFPALIIFQLVLPTVILYLLIKFKKIDDWDIRNRQQRYKFLPLFLFSWIIAGFFVFYYGNALVLRLFAIILVLAFFMAVITRFWKISGHAMLNTGAAILINFLFNWQLPWLYLFIPLVCWSRYTLKHHTLSQLIAGVVVSSGFILASLRFFAH